MTNGYSSHPRIMAAADVALMRKLNRDYIDLLAGSGSEGGDPLDSQLMQELAAADVAARDAIAACPYSLFKLDSGSDARMDGLGVPQVNDPVTLRYSGLAGESGTWLAFITAAWFFAWHLSRKSPLSARFMLGLDEGYCAMLAGFLPWQLRHLAAKQPAPLPPRWRTNPCFWPDLVRFARGRQTLRLTAAHLLGVQLLGAEAATASRSRSRSC